MAAASGGKPPSTKSFKWSYNPLEQMGKRWKVNGTKNRLQFISNDPTEPNYYRKMNFDTRVIYILEMNEANIPLTLFWNQTCHQMYYINGGICDLNNVNFNRINTSMVAIHKDGIDDLQNNYGLGLVTVRSENENTNNTFTSALISNPIPMINVNNNSGNNNNNNNNNSNKSNRNKDKNDR